MERLQRSAISNSRDSLNPTLCQRGWDFFVRVLASNDKYDVASRLAFRVQSKAAPAPLAVQLDPIHQTDCLLRFGHGKGRNSAQL